MLSSLQERNSGGGGKGSWPMPGAGHGHVSSAQDQFPEGVLGFMEQLKSPLSQQGTGGLVIAALWFCTRSVNHTNCSWKKSKPFLGGLQTRLSKMVVTLEESQQVPRRLWEVQCCLHKKTGSISERCQWLIYLGQLFHTGQAGTPQDHITALSTLCMAHVSTTLVLLGRKQAHPHQVLWRHEVKFGEMFERFINP